MNTDLKLGHTLLHRMHIVVIHHAAENKELKNKIFWRGKLLDISLATGKQIVRCVNSRTLASQA